MFCSKCGGPLEAGAGFCRTCGQEVEQNLQADGSPDDMRVKGLQAVSQALEHTNPWPTLFTKQTDFRGRANRAEFWIGNLILALWLLAVSTFFEVTAQYEESADISEILLLLAASLALLGSVFYSTFLTVVLYVRRLHDVGANGWLAILGLIPFVNVVIFVILGFKSPAGPNKFGPPRRS